MSGSAKSSVRLSHRGEDLERSESALVGALARVRHECPWEVGHGEHGPVALSSAQESRIRAVVTWLQRLLPPPARILDIGTGQALLPATLGLLGYEATGLDDWGDPWHSSDAEGVARAWAKRMGFQLVFEPAEQYRPPDPFDAVIM